MTAWLRASSDRHRPPHGLENGSIIIAPTSLRKLRSGRYWLHSQILGGAGVVPDRWLRRDRQQCRRADHPPHYPEPENALFAGHDAGAQNWAIISSLIETCKLNGVDLQAWLAKTLCSIVADHKQNRINDLLPWNYATDV